MIRVVAFLGAVGAAAVVSAVETQQPPASIHGQMPELGRPTRGDDPLPLFDFDQYFVGTWSFEWDVPESPLGPAGTIKGSTTYRPLGAGFYEANTEADGPAGRVIIKEAIAYRPENKTLSRWVTDSRGFAFLQIGPIGGDLGGYYNIYFESAPFTYGGKVVRLKNAMHLLSPINYRVATTISIEGGPFSNFGNPWWRKNVTH